METKSYNVRFIGPNGEKRVIGRSGRFVNRIENEARFATFTQAEEAARLAKAKLGNTWETSITPCFLKANS